MAERFDAMGQLLLRRVLSRVGSSAAVVLSNYERQQALDTALFSLVWALTAERAETAVDAVDAGEPDVVALAALVAPASC